MKRGLVLGKFMPPHAGHRLLFDFARNFVDQLTILVCSRPTDPIPGDLRQAWIAAMFPDCRVEHFKESALPADVDDPLFWQTWRGHIRHHHPEDIDYLITPETYGNLLADKLGVTLVPTLGRLSVSGTDIRNDPFLHWSSIPECVRPFYLKRVCVPSLPNEEGPTLASRLADAFGTWHVPRYVADHLSAEERHCAQRAANKCGETRAERVLFLETDNGHGEGDASPVDLYLLDAAAVAQPVAGPVIAFDADTEETALPKAITALLRGIPELSPYLVDGFRTPRVTDEGELLHAATTRGAASAQE